MSDSKKTPLYQWHKDHQGRIVDFAGWQMPVQYVGIKNEHQAVRERAGLFDVSHMGEILVEGPKALETLQWLTSNDVSKLKEYQAQYTLLMNPDGGIVDDMIVYCLDKNHTKFLLCVNAANEAKDWEFIQQHNKGAELRNVSSEWGQIALQGPKAMEILARVYGDDVKDLAGFYVLPTPYKGTPSMIARTGYTGEDGVEIFVKWDQTLNLWEDLLEAGKSEDLIACGLGARDTLRLEKKFPLYGQELTDATNPYSAGLGWVTKPKAKDFLGRDKVLAEKEAGIKQKMIGFELIEKGVPRTGYSLISFDNQEIGKVTSGTMSPSLDRPIGIAYIDAGHSEVGSEFYVEIRSRKVKAKVVKTPFV